MFVFTSVVNDVGTTKIKSSWDEDDKKKVFYNKKIINLLQAAICMDEFFRVSQCTTIKEIWDTLVVTHEVTTELKKIKIEHIMSRV